MLKYDVNYKNRKGILKMTINNQNWKWFAVAFLAAIFIPTWRHAVGVIVFIMGLPYIYHILRHDDKAQLSQMVLMFVGAFFMFWH